MNAAARLLNQGVLSRGWVVSLFFSRSQFSLLALTLSVAMSALGVVYVTHVTRNLNAGIQQAISDRDNLHVQWGQLLLEKSTWVMQARIQTIAENKLGMSTPDSRSVVVVNER